MSDIYDCVRAQFEKLLDLGQAALGRYAVDACSNCDVQGKLLWGREELPASIVRTFLEILSDAC